ncbi:hypothetical protein Ddye_017828 [Dipteronia dyeriana]|uniref:Uncharacterized protein n=1 Tax=Dipteronia dyeriana TaxID=168575 RepID=A0AAD9X067_9ROSI|nr:hypothetical protein Ddye_017828 [Dipteronia dyeriana]
MKPLDARLIYSNLEEEEELLNSIDQLLQSDDESAVSSTIDVHPRPDTTISVQQQQAEPGSSIMVHVLPSETESVDTSLMFDPQELLYGPELDQFLESMAADQTQEESKADIPVFTERLMRTYNLEELDQLYDDESMAAETQEISGPISAQRTGSNIVQVLHSETEPDPDQELMFSPEEEELFYSTTLDQLLELVH